MPDESQPAQAEKHDEEVTRVAPPPVDPEISPEPAPPKSYLEQDFPSGLCVRENLPEQGGGFSAYFEKAGTDVSPATVEFSYSGTGDTAAEAVQALCEGLADCLRARDRHIKEIEEASASMEAREARRAFSNGMVDPAAPAHEFDKQVEEAREEHVRLQARRPGQR